MNRRTLLKGLATKAAGGAVVGLAAGCGMASAPIAQDSSQVVAQDTGLPEISWQMATSWPVALDTIFGGAVVFAERVAAMTGGKFKIEPRAAGELAPGGQVLDVVSQGAVPIGHTASYYYVGKSPVTAFGTSLPFGLNAQQQNAWLYEGGGLDMMQDIYRDRFGVIQFPAGNTGVQMGGWFNKEIRSLADMQGLKMRIPGLGGRVMERIGVTVQVIAGGEIFQSLQTGAIDAAEWVGPYDDTKLDFQSVASFYYYPGWWEPGPSLEVQFPVDAYDALPEEYREVIKTAAKQANVDMMARYDALNPPAFQEILADSSVTVLPFPDDVMEASEDASFALFDENAAADPDFKSVLDSWKPFRSSIRAWHATAETAFLNYRSKQ